MTTKNNELCQLSNIGKVLSERLNEVGIETIRDLKSLGSEKAFLRIKTVHNDACINELFALEGAIQGIRWHDLDKAKKEELRAFHQMLKK